MLKVLIVDDKIENIYLLQAMLETNGFKTISAKNGAEALGLSRTLIPDLIIADILMPVMDGFTLCRECKKDEVLKRIPFFFYTATYIDAKDEEYALGLGADRFILKPQEPEVFIKIINDFLEEFENKKFQPRKLIEQPEIVVLKEYNEVLIRKIEDKMVQSEKSEKELKKYAEELEKEIDERKRKEESLRKSEEYNRLLFTASPIGLALSRMDGSLIDINPAFARIIGRTIEETLKLAYRDITPDKYATQEAEQLQIIKETGRYGKFEKELIHKEGHLVPVILQGLILVRDGERLIWSSVEDITERKKAEADLESSQQLFQTLAQVSPVGIFRTTPDGKTTYVNPKYSELSGISQEEALGFGWLNAVHSLDRGKLSELWMNNLISNNESSAEYRFVKPDGSVTWVLGNAVPEMTGNEIAGYIGTITDITERRMAEEELLKAKDKAEESDRLKTAFLHNISHEVRTPMNAVVGFSNLIGDPELTPEIRNEFAQTIIQASNQLLSIITQIVNMATIEAGQEDKYEEDISLNSIFKTLSDQFIPEAARKNLTLEYSTGLSDNEDVVRTDETKLVQVITNLLANALRFTKEGTISFGYTLKGKFLEFYVKDTGIGIQEDLHEIIFERFRQVETTLAREYEGAGLGLSISKAYVEMLGGKIWVNSRPGEGSVFYFTIPFDNASSDTKPIGFASEESKKELKKPVTILVTEDVDNNFKLIVQYLTGVNIDIVQAVNGQEAIDKCETNMDIQLVLMDLKMPVMDGFEATRRIKAMRPDLPVIAQSAYARDTDKAKALECGCSDFLCKPFKKQELIDIIGEYLDFD